MSGILRSSGGFLQGYTAIAEMNGKNADMLMDFGILRMQNGDVYEDEAVFEKAYLLISGHVTLRWDGNAHTENRENCFDVPPTALHVPDGVSVAIIAHSDDVEIAVMRTINDLRFPARLHAPADTPDEYRGAGLMHETSTRIVRTIFDYSTAPEANLVLGEVIGFPGKWSSYPPHHHLQPEIYFYKCHPENGFAYAELGDDVYKIHNNDVSFIGAGLTHPHVTAPGYALWYLWVIRHLPGKPYITPTFVPEHTWVTEKDAAIWPDGGK